MKDACQPLLSFLGMNQTGGSQRLIRSAVRVSILSFRDKMLTLTAGFSSLLAAVLFSLTQRDRVFSARKRRRLCLYTSIKELI